MERILLTLALLLMSSTACAEEIALVNGGFEQPSRTVLGVPGWNKIQRAGMVAYKMNVDDTEHAVGEHSFRIERIAPSPFGMLTQLVDAGALAGRKLQISARLKTREVGPAGFVLAVSFMQGGKTLQELRSSTASGTTEWNKVQIESVVPPSATQVKLELILRDAGIGWADEVQLIATGKASARTPGEPDKASTSRTR